MVNVYIIDDEPVAIDVIKFHLNDVPDWIVCSSTTNPIEGLMFVQNNPVDIVFIDIQMPKLSGLDFIKTIGNKCKIVIVSAYAQYALDGFEHNVMDYLMKPVKFERLLKTVQKFHQLSSQPTTENKSFEKEESNYIYVKAEAKGKYIKILFEDIVYVEGLKNYVSIYTETERIITLLSIKELEEKLHGKGFIRVHKSYIIATKEIKAVEGNQIIMRDKKYVLLGDTYRNDFFKLLNENLIDSQKK